MSDFNTAQLEYMLAKGLTLADAIEIAKLGKKRNSNAERQARWRARNRPQTDQESVTNNVTDNALSPPIDIIHTPLVSSNDETARPSKPRKAPPAKQASKPDDVTEPTWRDFSALRRKKGGPVSETALEGIREEATKAGWTLEAALKKCVARNWQGFEASWLETAKASQPAQNDDFMAHMARKAQGVPSG